MEDATQLVIGVKHGKIQQDAAPVVSQDMVIQLMVFADRLLLQLHQ
jgi:hypothetical protein